MKIFEGFEKGINLDGWLSQCCHTPEHYRSFIGEDDIRSLSEWNIDHIRVPVDYELFEAPDGSFIADGFAIIHKTAQWCRKYGLNMILDLHKTAGFSFDSGENETGFFGSEALQERFYRLWVKMAEEFGQYKDLMAFELLNEITDKEFGPIWNRIAAECIRRIRNICPDVYILVGGYWNNCVLALSDIDIPVDEHIVYNFHCYEPLIFTHQGAQWIDGMPVDFKMSFPESKEKYSAAVEKLHLSTLELVNSMEISEVDGQIFDLLFGKAAAIAEKNNVPLYCGEFGVIDSADSKSTSAWYKAITDSFRKYGIGHAAWSYKKMDFGISDSEPSLCAAIKSYL